MPRLSLPPPPGPPLLRLRRGKDPRELATLEAIAHAVAWLDGEEAARPLFALFELFVARSQVYA